MKHEDFENYKKITVHDSSALPSEITPLNTLFVLSNSYMVASKDKAERHDVRILSSTGYEECIGVMARLKSTSGDFKGAALAHITVANDEKSTIHEMLKHLQLIDPLGTIEIVLIGGKHNGPFEKPNHEYGNDLYEGIIENLSKHNVCDLTFDDTYRMLIAVDLKSGKVFAWDADEQATHIFEAVNLALLPRFASGQAIDYYTQTTALDNEVKTQRKRLPALNADWTTFTKDVKHSLKTHKEPITQELQYWCSEGLTLKY